MLEGFAPMADRASFEAGKARATKSERDAQKPLPAKQKSYMARVSGLTLPEYPPDIMAESLGSGTDCLIPGGLPLDITSLPLVNGERLLQHGSIVNRLYPTDPTLPPLPFKYWNNASADALQDFFFVVFQIDDASGIKKDSNADPGCSALRYGTMIYEDRLPTYWAAVDAAKKLIVRQRYTLLISRKVAL